MSDKRYLGDGVYAEWESLAFGDVLILTTEDGRSTTNTIHLDQERIRALRDFINDAEDEHQ